jgi:RNA polymerase sigma-70 factor (ECF subfamily)
MTEDSFNELFRAHFGSVWGFVRRRTESDADADDVTAETFAVAWRRGDELASEPDRLWLFGVARGVLANHRRSRERQQRLHLRLASAERPPETRADGEPVLAAALAELSEDDRELLLLRAWDGLEVAEIARVLDISAANVSSRLYKARSRLRSLVDRAGQRRERAPGRTGNGQNPRKENSR